jgi:carbon monoxide dehydrogenase subunit G
MAINQEHAVVIDRPIEEVFAFVTDPTNDSLWQAWTLETEQTSEGPIEVGSTLRSTAKMLGRRIEVTMEVTENDPPHRQCVRITSGPIPASGCYQLEPADDGSTRFTQTFKGEVGGFFRMAEPLVGRVISRQTEADMATLKDLLESSETEGS